MNVGGVDFDAEDMLAFIHNMMKSFPKLTAREILWSYFLPNDQSVDDAQNQMGVPYTVNEVVSNTIRYQRGDSGLTPKEFPGIYSMSIFTRYRLPSASVSVDCIVAVANSHNHARSIAAQRSNSYKDPPSYESSDTIWNDTQKTSCQLVAEVSNVRFHPGSVLFAGSALPNQE